MLLVIFNVMRMSETDTVVSVPHLRPSDSLCMIIMLLRLRTASAGRPELKKSLHSAFLPHHRLRVCVVSLKTDHGDRKAGQNALYRVVVRNFCGR